jgi:DNA primase small subunit
MRPDGGDEVDILWGRRNSRRKNFTTNSHDDDEKFEFFKMTTTFDLQHLRVFYEKLYPYNAMYQWISYGEQDLFWRREFSFTLANDVYIRYLSFQNAEEFKDKVKKDQPHKIDIGPVYSCAAKDHITVSASKFRPTQRELVFDLDLDDFSDAQVGKAEGDGLWAKGAWGFMATAIKVVDRSLREDFGYQHILWVFSGRRGVHCWVCDEQARLLEDHQRSAVVEYLSLVQAGDGVERVRITHPLHPAVKRSLEICEDMFDVTMLRGAALFMLLLRRRTNSLPTADDNQGLLRDEANWRRVLDLLPNEPALFRTLKDDLINTWTHEDGMSLSSKTRWKQLCMQLDKLAQSSKSKFDTSALLKAKDQLILLHSYPRLDEAVSIHRNHLLKAPFVIHPKTGKVCVPIFDVARCHEFDPDKVPNLKTLIEELDNNSENSKTSLDEYVERFTNEFLQPMTSSKQQQQQQRKLAKKDEDAAVSGDW